MLLCSCQSSYDFCCWLPLLLKLLSNTVENHTLTCKAATTNVWFPALMGSSGLLGAACISLVNSLSIPTEAISDVCSSGVSLTHPSHSSSLEELTCYNAVESCVLSMNDLNVLLCSVSESSERSWLAHIKRLLRADKKASRHSYFVFRTHPEQLCPFSLLTFLAP